MPVIQRWKLREPFSGLSHLGGAVLSAAGLVVLIALSLGKPWHLTAFAIYGCSMVLLYSASAVYHLLPVEPQAIERLRALDMAAIYLLIAGTYTPVCVLSLRGAWGFSLLAVVWTIAIAGALARLFWRAKPDWLSFAMYLLLGWGCVVVVAPLFSALRWGGISWLMLGGLCYTIGAVIFATQRPRLWPGRFGSHDLWHVCVLSGSACHFVMMLCFVARTP
jgi:hemolysin III